MMPQNPHLPPNLETEEEMRLRTSLQQYQAAILRGDPDAAERIRREAHDVLDANLDLNAEAAMAVRAIIGQ